MYNIKHGKRRTSQQNHKTMRQPRPRSLASITSAVAAQQRPGAQHLSHTSICAEVTHKTATFGQHKTAKYRALRVLIDTSQLIADFNHCIISFCATILEISGKSWVNIELKSNYEVYFVLLAILIISNSSRTVGAQHLYVLTNWKRHFWFFGQIVGEMLD